MPQIGTVISCGSPAGTLDWVESTWNNQPCVAAVSVVGAECSVRPGFEVKEIL